jgi:putative transposase
MPHDYLLFITWRTWAGRHAVDEVIAHRLVDVLPGLATAEDADVVELAILPNHVHVLVEVTTATQVPRLVQRLKGATARFANRDHWSRSHLRWAQGYDVRTVGRGGLSQVTRYLDQQGERHGLPLLARWSGSGRAARTRAA